MLHQAIETACSGVTRLVERAVGTSDAALFIKNPVSPEIFGDVADLAAEISNVINAKPDAEPVSDTAEAPVADFQAQSLDFALLMGLTNYADSVLHQMVAGLKPVSGADSETASETTTGKLCVLLDLVLALAAAPQFPSAKTDFYAVLQHVCETLFDVSTHHISTFWNYVETRTPQIKQTVFNAKTTSNRIAVLGLCNGLTDRFYTRNKNGKLDSYEKDTFNDNFQARVRLFLASLLDFDDSTGLNKYFAVANRVNREPNLGVAKTGDDELLQDILNFRKLLRDPYWFLRNSRSLGQHADSLTKLHAYLLGEEAKYSHVHKPRDVYAVEKEYTEAELSLLKKKYHSLQFFPEQYWLSPFESVQRGPQFEAVKAEDRQRASALFDDSKFRKLLLIQIYLVACFFVELQASRKKQVLANIGAQPTTKHIVEDSTPDAIAAQFLKIKREILRSAKTWDSQFAFMLQHISQAEESWWAWLICPKRKDGSSLFSSKTIESEIGETQQKFDAYLPLKTKRYFNTHGTPQLSRRMKTKTGLELLKKADSNNQDYDAAIEQLNAELKVADDAEKVEERTVLLWKKLHEVRGAKWLDVDGFLDMELLGREFEKNEPEVKQPEKKEPAEENSVVKEPEMKEPEVKEPEVKESEMKEQEIVEPVKSDASEQSEKIDSQEKAIRKTPEKTETEQLKSDVVMVETGKEAVDVEMKDESSEPVEEAVPEPKPDAADSQESRKRERSTETEEAKKQRTE